MTRSSSRAEFELPWSTLVQSSLPSPLLCARWTLPASSLLRHQALSMLRRVSVFDGDDAGVRVDRLWEGAYGGAGLCGLQSGPQHLSPGAAEESRCAGCQPDMYLSCRSCLAPACSTWGALAHQPFESCSTGANQHTESIVGGRGYESSLPNSPAQSQIVADTCS